MSPIQTRRDGDIAVILIDNPPVNALKHSVRQGLVEALAAADGDPAVAAIVLAGKGRNFAGGADITEFGKPPMPPSLRDVITVLEVLKKPVVAAIAGVALGGGLELALGCPYRVAAPDARLGLPEVKLGILPGAGGTQRLPRVIGAERALRMIVSGDPVDAAEALKLGLVSEVIQGDLIEGAVRFAHRIATARPTRVRDSDGMLASARADRAAFDALAAELTRKMRLRAPQACVEAVRACLDLPIDQGLAHERALFEELVASEESKAQRHLFFAEREAAKVATAPGAKPRPIERVAVIGAGTMGSGIAMAFANAGIPVILSDSGPEPLARGRAIIERNYKATVARGGLSQSEMDRRIGLIEGAEGLDGVSTADLVIEAVPEEMDLKLAVFSELDRRAKPGAILATNTSTLDVNRIAEATSRPESVLGLHFFSPANVMRLLEIVRGGKTADDVLLASVAVARRMGKVPVIVGVCDGFVGNRMLHKRLTAAERLLLGGALPQDVDAAAVDFGFAMGPFATSDLAGIDVGWRVRKGRGTRAEISDSLAEMGRFGQKTNAGFYRYEPGSRTPLPDPEVEALILDRSQRAGTERRSYSREEILERLLFPMVNEAARILEEGIAARPGDVDVIWANGYGWPVGRGGPLFHADRIGLAHVRDRLKAFAREYGDANLEPAPLLERLAAEGRGFASLV